MKKLLILLLLSVTFISLNAQVEIFRPDNNTEEVEEEQEPEEDDDYDEEDVIEYEDDDDDSESISRNSQRNKRMNDRNFKIVLLPDFALNFGDARDNYGDEYSYFNFGIQPKLGMHFKGLSVALGPTYQYLSFNYYFQGIEDQKVHGWGGAIVAQYELPQIGGGIDIYPLLHAEYSAIRYKLSNFEIPFGFSSAPVGGGTKYMFSDRAFAYGLLLYDLTMLDSDIPLLGLQYRASFGFYF